MTTPETVYDLLALVAHHIEEEPRRYFQDVWVLIGEEIRNHVDFEPACGTVCCRAGWIVALHDGLRAPAIEATARARFSPRVELRALQILGMSDVGFLFNAFISDEDDLDEDSGDLVSAEPGTPEYAKAGADGLRAFMEEHAEHLKARRLADVPPLEEGRT